ncbi:MAG: glycoside hydrolase family 127 protein [Gemmatimonadetes bacterium]|nr:glycoside hydrolase family 127 protein [Gemmatimonadota bacterium]
MTISRRTVVKLGLGAGAVPLLARVPLVAQEEGPVGLTPGAPGQAAPLAPGSVVTPAVALRARPLPLSAVRVLGGPLGHAQELDAAYLLSLEPDRMLAYYRERAGLKRKAEPYGGWDGGGRNLTGHIAGHHLSAVSLMYAAGGDERFKARADYIVAELKEVQDANGDGYLVALENGRRCFGELARGEIRSAAFDLNGEWSPWYTLHKTFAGLRDAYRYTDNRTALDVEVAFAAWAEGILSGLDDAQIQRMLGTEFGGMNEVMVDLYADTGDRRWLDLSYKFEHRAFIEPLQRHQDDLAGKHGNTQIPKVVGSVERYVLTGDARDLIAASFFWDEVAQHHSFATGGHGTDEYFGPPDELSDRVDGRTCESCNVYNMLKLTRRLFALQPDAHYADFQERALFNHVLASIDPDEGRMCYMVPVGRGVTHEYQDMLRSFTCCVGSGMENHALHGDGIYNEDGDRLWVNLYVPSTAEWAGAGASLTMETDFPEGETAKLTLTVREPRDLTVALRRPYWAGNGFTVRVNGVAMEDPDAPAEAETGPGGLYAWPKPVSTYFEIRRTWHTGDTVEVTLPKTLRSEPLPDNPTRMSLMWGPLVLAGDLGPEPERTRGGPRPAAPVVPVFVSAEEDVASWVKPVSGSPGRFRSDAVGREPNAEGRPHDVDFAAFYRLPRRTYSTYWDVFTPEAWEKVQGGYKAEAERLHRLELATVAYVQPGEIMFERRFNYQGAQDSNPTRIMGRPGRTARSWFSYDLEVQPAHPMALVVTYFSGDRRALPAAFDILVDGSRVASPHLEETAPRRFFDVTYPVPEAVVADKANVTVRFQAHEGSQVATVFGVRMIRSDGPE